ncbi:phosphatidylglycerol lysyltransferase domain-containing protein [Hymenobacter sp. B81]|uniref:phosphatidylglycerol lysyltransferase domain-containing protein n=1 Tax=Hymenobacter sp. B81 TaxID=3344878 RepID=UPI0037DD55A6
MIAADRFARLRQCASDPNAYAALQPGLRYFDHPAGFVAYRRTLAGNVVLGDPVAEPAQASVLLSAFLQAHPGSVFGYLSETGAAALAQASGRRMRFVRIGTERCLDLTQPLSFSASTQGALKKARKARLQVTERNLSELGAADLAQLRAINAEFIRLSPSKKEIGFISRLLQLAPEPDVRFFVIEAAATPIGFCVLDPWYEGAQLKGYQLHQFRLLPTKIWGVFLSVVALLAEQLRAEGYRCLSLGGCIGPISPGEQALPVSGVYDYCRDLTFRLIDRYHPLTNLSKNKFEFAGTDLNRYLAAPHRLPLIPLARLARANNIL